MAKMLKQTRMDLLGLSPDYGEQRSTTPTEYKMPSRLRGEVFNQPLRAIYVFGKDIRLMPLSLRAFHDQRLIVVEMEVATVNSVTAEWPSLERRKVDFANKILAKLRTRYVGLQSKLVRLLKSKKSDYQLHGPFIPHEPGIAVVSLVIRVGLDSNYDEAYKIAQRFLELHPENEKLKHFKEAWNKSKPSPNRQRPPGIYQWTHEELDAIGSMAQLEPAPDGFGAGRTLEERLRFNDIVWRQCQQNLQRFENNYDHDLESQASTAASKILKESFSRF